MCGLIGYDSSIGEPEFERDGVVGCRRSSLVEETEQLLGLMMASQRDRHRFGRIGPESIVPVRAIEEGDVVALSMEMIGGREAGEAGPDNEHCV